MNGAPLAAGLLALALLWLPATGWAHTASDSYLELDRRGAALAGRWDIALRDLEHAIGLDTDGDGAITWGELRARHRAIAAYALAQLRIGTGEADCVLEVPGQRVARRGDGTYTVLDLRGRCPAGGGLTVDYRLLFDLDPTHRGLLVAHQDGHATTAVLSPERPRIRLEAITAMATLGRFWTEGVRHILAGADHVLFLLTLLLPAVLRREGRQWRPVAAFRPAGLEVAGTVTAFTAAHALTLSAAALGLVSPPSAWVEPAIALTVVAAAANNLWPVVRERRWLLAFAVGLVHGFGFAGTLAELGLPGQGLAPALAGFNLGVESGQLVVVLCVMPLAFALRSARLYRRGVMPLGSAGVAVVGLGWFVHRLGF